MGVGAVREQGRAPRRQPGSERRRSLAPLLSKAVLVRWYRFVQVAACVPVLIAVVAYLAHGFYPTNDDAYTGLSVLDVLNGHWPIQGAHSTASANTGVEVHHPGPLYYYLLALPVLIGGKTSASLVIGQALIALGCILGSIAVARRLGGVGLATAVAAGSVIGGLLLGQEVYARPFNPYPSALVLPALLLLTWAVLDEHYDLLWAWVFAISLSVQPHLGNLPLACALIATVIGVGLVRWWRRRHRIWPFPGWRRVGAVRARRHFLGAAALAFVLWLPPIIELFTLHPNNFTQLIRYLQARPIEPVIGVGPMTPWMLEMGAGTHAAQPRGNALLFHHPPGSPVTLAAAFGLLLLLALVALPLLARRWAPRTAGRLLVWNGLLIAALVIFDIGLGRLPPLGFISWEYVQVPQAWALVWTTLVWEAWWALRLAAAHGALLRGQPSAALQQRTRLVLDWFTPTRARRVLAATAVVAMVAVGWSNLRQDSQPQMLSTGRDVRTALPVVREAIKQLNSAPNAPVLFDGDSIGSAYSVGWGLAFGLMRQGYQVHIATFGSLHEYWDYRKYTTAPTDVVRVYSITNSAFPKGFVPEGTVPVTTLPNNGNPVRIYVYVGLPPS